jgi:hypothetical protein
MADVDPKVYANVMRISSRQRAPAVPLGPIRLMHALVLWGIRRIGFYRRWRN